MRIGIYGGTFDPPHNGHINICREFLKLCRLDRLLIVPAFDPPHKEVVSHVGSKDRFNMASIAFSDISDKIEISNVELQRKGKSYTSDTIKYFKNDENIIYLLCGTDMFLTLDTWHEASYIFENATIVFARRENDDKISKQISDKISQYEKIYNAKILFLPSDVIEISSSKIRRDICEGNSVSDIIPNGVLNYIVENNLYGDLPNDR